MVAAKSSALLEDEGEAPVLLALDAARLLAERRRLGAVEERQRLLDFHLGAQRAGGEVLLHLAPAQLHRQPGAKDSRSSPGPAAVRTHTYRSACEPSRWLYFIRTEPVATAASRSASERVGSDSSTETRRGARELAESIAA